MPSRLTAAGLRWIRIAEKDPERESLAIFKLTEFALKLETDGRAFDRLIRQAETEGHAVTEIARAADMTASAVAAITSSPIDETNRPKESRIGDALTQLMKLAPAAKKRRELLDDWVIAAIKAGWSVEDAATAASITTSDVERIAADELQKQRDHEARLCPFCRRRKDSVSGYCKYAEDHQARYYAKTLAKEAA